MATIPADKTELSFYSRTDAAWDVLYADCAAAKISIEFEQYIFVNDEAGNRFLKLFIEKAKQGVAVRLMLDGIGSHSLSGSEIVDELRQAGGMVSFYNMIGWRQLWTPSKWLPRSHNKIMLIDSSVAHISSVGIWQVMKDWQDLHMRLTGGLAAVLHDYFIRLWQQGGRKYRAAAIAPAASEAPFRFVVSEPRLGRSLVYKELLLQIARAKRRVCIVSPYFLPPFRLRRALKKAAQRGVDVRVVISAKSDVPIADYVSRSYFPALLRRRVRLFLYQPAVLHAKYAFIDDDWATAGSTNIDYLSLLQNREANIVTRDAETIEKLGNIFDDTIRNAVEADKSFWRKIPLHQKILGYLGRTLRRVI